MSSLEKVLTGPNGEDISKLKIYYDFQNKNYRTRFFCSKCGDLITCICHESLKKTIEEKQKIQQGDFLCYSCAIDAGYSEDDIEACDSINGICDCELEVKA